MPTDEADAEPDAEPDTEPDAEPDAAGAQHGEPPAPTPEEEAALAAALALARARASAVERGLRPGLRPPRKRRRLDQPTGTPSGSAPDGRDPMLLGEQLDRLMSDRGWQVDVAVGSVLGRWPQIVGPEVADHVQPVSFADGVLTVRAESTAWATQMRLLTSMLLGRLEQEVGVGTVSEIAVTGPSAPSWSKADAERPVEAPATPTADPVL